MQATEPAFDEVGCGRGRIKDDHVSRVRGGLVSGVYNHTLTKPNKGKNDKLKYGDSIIGAI